MAQGARARADRLGLHIGICFNHHDMQRLEACKTDAEFASVHSRIQTEISRVYRSNLAINHSNFRNQADIVAREVAHERRPT